jgi:hypothetical protein
MNQGPFSRLEGVRLGGPPKLYSPICSSLHLYVQVPTRPQSMYYALIQLFKPFGLGAASVLSCPPES